MQKNQPKSAFEEACNALSHLIAAIFFLILSINSPEATSTAYSLIFSGMFFSSFLYHSQTRWKYVFRNIDMFFIYIVIGATGLLVPQVLDSYHTLLILSLLSLSAIHHAMRGVLKIPEGYAIPIFYLLNGLVVAYFIMCSEPLTTNMLYLSLLTYLAGFVFYINDHIKYFHTGWHIACSTGAYFMYCHLINNLS